MKHKTVASCPKEYLIYLVLTLSRNLWLSLEMGLVFLFLLLMSGLLHAQNTRLWATYYGGTGADETGLTVTDISGNVYLSGRTTSVSGIASGGFQNTYGGGAYDAFLVKFDASGNRLWATYYGGTGSDEGRLPAIDILGNVYLSGYTGSASGIASGGFQNTIGGGDDAFLVKFDAGGNRLWATYYGGTALDYGYRVVIDALSNVYLTGATTSASGIASGGFQNTIGGGGDAFLVKFDAGGNRLWATYYGGTGNEGGASIAFDALDNVYLTGSTTSASGIASGGFQNTYGGGLYDAFLVKFDGSGNRLWATYYGGTGTEISHETVTDAAGNVYLSGPANSVSGIASGGFQNTFGGGTMNAFLVKFDGSGNRLWATYYGGATWTYGYSVATDASGNVYLAGTTQSASGIASGGFQNTFGGGDDAFLVKFDASGNRLCATYYGGSNVDYSTNVATDALGNVYISGFTSSISGIASIGFQNTYGGGTRDAYLVKFTSCFNNTLNVTTISTSPLCSGQCTGTGTANPGSGSPPYTYAWSNSQTTQTISGLCAGTYTVIVTDGAGDSAATTVTITQPAVLTAAATATAANCGNDNGTTTVNASGGTPGYTYSWSNGQTTQTATGLTVGNYTATVTDANGCIATQTVTVVSSGSVTAINQSVIICSGFSYTLPGGIVVSTGGIYNDTLTSVAGCDSIITTILTVNSNPTATVVSIPSMLGQVVTIAQGQIVSLAASGGGTYSWSSGSNGSFITVAPLVTTLYCVTVTDANNCTDTACVTVTIEPLDCSNAGELYLPNAFSPNNDGENDKLYIYYGNPKCIRTFKLIIYNRWGEKVFETTNPTAQWDGTFKGKTEGTTVFVYYLEATFTNGKKITKKGNISLIK